MEEFQTHTLPNGLRLIYRPTQSAVSYCGFTVNAGTRDEDEGYSGLAHFVEHTIFKGTTHRRASHILNRMDRGELKNILFMATGALMSTTSSQQGESIPGIAHLVHVGRG